MRRFATRSWIFDQLLKIFIFLKFLGYNFFLEIFGCPRQSKLPFPWKNELTSLFANEFSVIRWNTNHAGKLCANFLATVSNLISVLWSLQIHLHHTHELFWNCIYVEACRIWEILFKIEGYCQILFDIIPIKIIFSSWRRQ